MGVETSEFTAFGYGIAKCFANTKSLGRTGTGIVGDKYSLADKMQHLLQYLEDKEANDL